MTISNAARAEILTKALPYIQRYGGKTVVVKYGGNAMTNSEGMRNVMSDILLLSTVGIRVVLVHGGGPEISDTLDKMGIESRFKDGLRVTDAQAMDVVEMVLAGKINKDLVNILGVLGGKAIGLSGIDGRIIQARQLDPELGFVGEVTDINTEPIEDVLEKGFIPVISTLGCGKDGEIYNINADTAAAKIAGKLKAESFICMTDKIGLLSDMDDESSLIHKLTCAEALELIREDKVRGGMIPKVECCVEAVRRGVNRVFIIDGRIEHSALIELFTDEGIGTMIV